MATTTKESLLQKASTIVKIICLLAVVYFVVRCIDSNSEDDDLQIEPTPVVIESIKPKITAAPPMKRYTMDDINAMLDEAEADFAAGKGIPDEEVWRKWDEELAREEQEALDDSRLQEQELEMAEMV